MLIFNGLEDYGLLLLRLALAAIFVYHGFSKIRAPSGMAQGIGWPVWLVFLLGLGEFVSGVLSLIGFLVEIAGIYFAIVMLGAIYYKIFKWDIGFAPIDKLGWEFDLIILGAALGLLLLGAGNISVDALMGLWP